MQVAVTRKCRMALYPVDPNAQEFRVVLVKLRKNFIVERHLIPVNRASVGRVECQDDWLSPQIREREVLIGRDPQREIRCNGSSS